MKNKLIKFIKQEVNNTGARGVVFGVSGGIDSAVIAYLANEAFGDKSLGIWIDIESSIDAQKLASIVFDETSIERKDINLTKDFKSLTKTLLNNEELDNFESMKGNLKSRLRMATIYSWAQIKGYVVLGTSNKSEFHLGYFTKYGDSAADIQPLINLKKKEVYELAKELNVNTDLINAAPSAGLWEGQTDEEDMGVSYSEIDKYLAGQDIHLESKKIIEQKHKATEHKRKLPVAFKK